MSAPRGVDVEIYEHPPLTGTAAHLGVIKPTYIRINGVDCLTPDGKPAVVEGLLDKKNVCTCTVTLFVRSLKVHGGSE